MNRLHNRIQTGFIVFVLAALMSACGTTPIATPTTAPVAAETVPTSTAVEAAPTAAPVAETAPTSAPAEFAPTAAPAPTVTAEPAVSTSMTKLNLNVVTGDQLLSTIPNFTNRMVREFEEYRPYISILQFRKEIGKYVDEATVAEYEQYVYVPVDINQADAATLQQIPGIDATIAESLIAGRPYASNQVFLDALATSASASQLATAAIYLVE